MIQYQSMLQEILDKGVKTGDRTGVGTISLFGMTRTYDLREGFPAVTTKKLAWKAVVSELLWFLEGSTDERRLAEIHYGKPRSELVGKTTIWTPNADSQGAALHPENTEFSKNLGPIYGHQWRFWGKDQICQVIDALKRSPDSRRIILSSWNNCDIEKMALPPCHPFVQFKVVNGHLDCMFTMRSNDVFLGAPFNIASYALLTHILAKEVGLVPGKLIHSVGDAHIYLNHVDQVKEQLTRECRPLPRLLMPENLPSVKDIGALSSLVNEFKLEGYDPHPAITGEMAV